MGATRFRRRHPRAHRLVPRRFLGRRPHQREPSLLVLQAAVADRARYTGLSLVDPNRPTDGQRYRQAARRTRRRHRFGHLRLPLRRQPATSNQENGMVLLLPQVVSSLFSPCLYPC